MLQVSEIRTVAADELWLSPGYGRDSVALHFTWIADAAAVSRWWPRSRSALAPFGARPHWGKVFTTDPATVRDRLPPAAERRGAVPPRRPTGKFRNPMVDRYL